MSDLISVIHAELYKALRKKRLYIFGGLWWFLLPLLSLTIAVVIHSNAGDMLSEGQSVSQILTQIASPLALLRNGLFLASMPGFPLIMMVLVIIATLMIGEERRNNMWKTVLTTQASRWTVLTGKLISGFLLLSIVLAGAYLAALLVGLVAQNLLPLAPTSSSTLVQYLGYFGLQWLFGAVGLLFTFLLMWLLGNQILGAIAAFFLPAFIQGLYSIYAVLVNLDPANNQFAAMLEIMQIRRTLEKLPTYFFDTNLYLPSRYPLAKLGDSLQANTQEVDTMGLDTLLQMPSLSQAGVTISIYGVIFAVLLYWSFARRDIA